MSSPRCFVGVVNAFAVVSDGVGFAGDNFCLIFAKDEEDAKKKFYAECDRRWNFFEYDIVKEVAVDRVEANGRLAGVLDTENGAYEYEELEVIV